MTHNINVFFVNFLKKTFTKKINEPATNRSGNFFFWIFVFSGILDRKKEHTLTSAFSKEKIGPFFSNRKKKF